MTKTKSKQSRGQTLMTFMDNKIIPKAAKIGNNKYLSAIRDAFSTILPIILIGSVGIIWRTVLFSEGRVGLFGNIAHWAAMDTGKAYFFDPSHTTMIQFLDIMSHMMLWVQTASMDLLGLWFTIAFAYFLGISNKTKAPIVHMLLLTFAWLAVTPQMFNGWGGAGTTWFSAKGLFSSILVVSLGSWIYSKLDGSSKLEIKMPAGVPPAVSRAFAKLLPGFILVGSFAIVNVCFYAGLHYGGVSNDVLPVVGHSSTGAKVHSAWAFTSVLYYFVMAPFLSFAGSASGGLGIAILYIFFIKLFWWFGIHGSNVMNGIFQPIFLTLLEENQEAITAGKSAPHLLVSSSFDSFAFLGIWGLFIASMIFSKFKARRELNKVALAPRIFNISEPIFFGYPFVLNIFLLIPAIVADLGNMIWTWAFTKWGFVRPAFVIVPWITPAFLSGLICTGFDYWSLVLTALVIAYSTLVFIPFIMLENRFEMKKEKELEAKEKAKLKTVATK